MFDLSILTSYSFLVVALGTLLLSISAASVGCITVLKGQSLIGDAIGHSTFPGIVLAFMVFQSRNPLLLSLGALVSGGVAFFLIQLVHQGKKTGLDSILGGDLYFNSGSRNEYRTYNYCSYDQYFLCIISF